MSERNTPTFGNPPVVDTVLGVQFEPLAGMHIVHYGLFWQLIRDRFPEVQEQVALEPESERFDDGGERSEFRWKLMERPELPRAWFLSEAAVDGQQLVQLQQDRLLLNWRRDDPATQRYPSFDEKNRPAFENVLRMLVRLAEEQGLGTVTANQCEVTYINHIMIDPDCSTPAEMFARCFPRLAATPSDQFLPQSPERASWSCSYRIPENRGRLHVAVRTARLVKTGQYCLDLRLTARAAPTDGTIERVLECLDLGHDWVVNGFKSFTMPEMHRVWELQT